MRIRRELLFCEETNAAYGMLKETVTQYCAIYTTYYKYIVQVPQETASEGLKFPFICF